MVQVTESRSDNSEAGVRAASTNRDLEWSFDMFTPSTSPGNLLTRTGFNTYTTFMQRKYHFAKLELFYDPNWYDKPVEYYDSDFWCRQETTGGRSNVYKSIHHYFKLSVKLFGGVFWKVHTDFKLAESKLWAGHLLQTFINWSKPIPKTSTLADEHFKVQPDNAIKGPQRGPPKAYWVSFI